MTISKEEIEKIMPHLKDVVPEEDWDTLPRFFERVYKLKYNDEHDSFVLARWDEDLPALAFDTETGVFLGVVTKEFVFEHGTPI